MFFMKVLLIYYTGTYNTRFLTNKVEERFVDLGYQVDKIEIDDDCLPIEINDYEYVGFSYPIYGFNAPLPFMKYFKKLKFNKGQKYFIFKNSGETMAMNNASSRKILRRMRRFNATFCGEYHFVMPYNIHFEFDQDFIKQIIIQDKKLLDVMFYNLSNGIINKTKSNIFYNIGSFFVSIQYIGGNVNSFFYKVDKKKCNKCGLCVKNCPKHNIEMNKGTVKFHHSCSMCMRCSFYCPKKAIHIGLLENWRVHSYYNLDMMWKEDKIDHPYINDNSKGFYKCYISYFNNIDECYEKISKEGGNSCYF